MKKAVLCSPEEMNRLQYLEESKMTFEERLKLAFGMIEISKAFSQYTKDFDEESDIKWIKLKMVNDRGL
jgi:hypothetical protein